MKHINYNKPFIKRLLKAGIAFLLTLLSYGAFPQSTQTHYLYLTPIDPSAFPDKSGINLTNNATLNQIFSDYGVYQYTQSFPGAKTPGLDLVHNIHFNGNADSLIVDLQGIGLFTSIEKLMYEEPLCSSPVSVDDPSLAGGTWVLNMIEAECAWSLTTGNPEVIVAVADSYFDVNHEDLLGKFSSPIWGSGVSPSACLNHGTGVAGLVAAGTNNNIGLAAIGHDVRLAGYRASYQSQTASGHCTGSVWPAVWKAYLDGRRVINVSWSSMSGASTAAV